MKNKGPLYVLTCYVIWGLLPIFWKLLAQVDSLYVLASRIVWSMVLTGGILLLRRHRPAGGGDILPDVDIDIAVIRGPEFRLRGLVEIVAVSALHLVEGQVSFAGAFRTEYGVFVELEVADLHLVQRTVDLLPVQFLVIDPMLYVLCDTRHRDQLVGVERMVRRAEFRRVQSVVPLVGPSSIILAGMAPGLNGQAFAFNGYLPVKPPERTRAIRFFERRALAEGQSQLFIEAPYRNVKLMEQLVQTLGDQTRLTVAVDLTAPDERIETHTAGEWRRRQLPEMNRRPAIFIIG